MFARFMGGIIRNPPPIKYIQWPVRHCIYNCISKYDSWRCIYLVFFTKRAELRLQLEVRNFLSLLSVLSLLCFQKQKKGFDQNSFRLFLAGFLLIRIKS